MTCLHYLLIPEKILGREGREGRGGEGGEGGEGMEGMEGREGEGLCTLACS